MSNDIDTYVISLEEEPEILSNIKEILPNAKIFPAIDLRKESPVGMLKKGYITYNTCESMLQKSRLRHKEINSGGAVGIFQSTKAALSEGSGPVLLLEDDCYLEKDFTSRLRSLQERSREFDVAVFGAHIQYASSSLKDVEGLVGWKDLTNEHALYMLNHCVYYTESGRRIISEALKEPQEVHVDAFFSLLSMAGELRLWVQVDNQSAHQIKHVSTIGHDSLLDTCSHGKNWAIIVLLIVLTITLMIIVRTLFKTRFQNCGP